MPAGSPTTRTLSEPPLFRAADAGAAKTPAPNGHKILEDGTHLVCDKGAVLHLDADGKRLADASSECDGKPLRNPNDLTIDPKGGFYFTDPGGSSLKNPIGTVHYVDARFGLFYPGDAVFIETLEVARVSTPIVALVVVRRLLSGVPSRLLARVGP